MPTPLATLPLWFARSVIKLPRMIPFCQPRHPDQQLRHGLGLHERLFRASDGAVHHHPVETPIYRVSTDLSCFKLFFPHPRLHPFEKFRRVVLEKVEIHCIGDAENEVAFQGGLAEDFVNVVAGAADFACQPAGAALVGLQLRLDEVPNVNTIYCFFHAMPCFRLKSRVLSLSKHHPLHPFAISCVPK